MAFVFLAHLQNEGELLLSHFVRRPYVTPSVRPSAISSETTDVRVLKLHTQNPLGV